MPDPKQLPYLLKLLDDESKFVKQSVFKELASFGPRLEEELMKLPKSPTSKQRKALQGILDLHNREWFREVWPRWFKLKDEEEKLEAAMSLIAEFQNGRSYPRKLKTLLDSLAEEFTYTRKKKGAIELSHFLFQTKQLKGVKRNHYNLQNSNLVYVIEKRQGIPLSLVCIFILVGKRLRLKIEGCNLPGHFLARIRIAGKSVFIDCFGGGKALNANIFRRMHFETIPDIEKVLEKKTSTKTIMARVLQNLILAYSKERNKENSKFFHALLNEMEKKGI